MTKLTMIITLLLISLVQICYGQSMVPGVMIFGDSVVDIGNNNERLTLIKADFPPYGRDFITHSPTGRFCNGKLAADFTIDTLGFNSSYPPAYLSKEANDESLLIGANFASGGSGYLDSTALLYDAISLPRQLRYFKQYQGRLRNIVGAENATAIINGSMYLLSAGSSDYLQNYYINPIFRTLYTPDHFVDLLIQSFYSFVKSLYKLGARRIGVTSLSPIGCLPASITLFGLGQNDCVESLNKDAILFNNKLNISAAEIRKSHPDLKLVIFDIFTPLLDLIQNPQNSGFTETRRACCGTGIIETSFLCNKMSPGTCKNASSYVFWDSFHPTEAANSVLADALLMQGIELIS